MRRKAGGKGTNNVLADLGFEDAEDLSAKALLAVMAWSGWRGSL